MPLKEKLLIQRIRRAAGRRGDRPDMASATTARCCDCRAAMKRWSPPTSAWKTFTSGANGIRRTRSGHRCLARGLSDIAAMGGMPHAAFLSLALPADLPQKWVDRFLGRIAEAGGSIFRAPGGRRHGAVAGRHSGRHRGAGLGPDGKAILRSGARAGDLLYVTGTLGSSVAALNQLRDGKKLRPRSHPKHFYPEPRIAVGQFLREKKLASAMIDISDGLSTDLGHICEESKTGAVVYAEALACRSAGEEAIWTLALHGGEEYELLFTAQPTAAFRNRLPECRSRASARSCVAGR